MARTPDLGARTSSHLVVPAVAAFAPWFVYAHAHRHADNTFDASVQWTAACPPLLGVLIVVAFGLCTRSLRLMWALLPWAAASLTFTASTFIVAKTNNPRLEFTSTWYSNVEMLAVYSSLLMPVLVAGGVYSLSLRFADDPPNAE